MYTQMCIPAYVSNRGYQLKPSLQLGTTIFKSHKSKIKLLYKTMDITFSGEKVGFVCV